MSPNLPAKIQPHPFLPQRTAWVAVMLVCGADCQYLCYTNTNTNTEGRGSNSLKNQSLTISFFTEDYDSLLPLNNFKIFNLFNKN